MRTPGRFGALCIGKDPRLKPLAETVERILDAFDIAEVRSQPDNHRTRSICRRISLIDSFRPQKIASPIRKCPILSSASCGMAAMGPTLSNVRPRSEEHTSELQSLMRISYAVFCLKNKTMTLSKLKYHT